MFDGDFIDKDEYSDNNDYSKVFGIIVLIITSILSFFGIVVAGLIYFVFFIILKWRPKMIALLLGVLSILSIIVSILLKPFANISISNYMTWVAPYLLISLWFGFVVGFIFVLWQARQLRIYPELKSLKGWSYKFEYKETIFDKLKRNALVKRCKNGSELSYDAAPMGVLIEPVELNDEKKYESIDVVNRYYSEAKKTTIITGGTGSGKSISMLNLMYNDIQAGYPLCVLDFKKGPDMAYLLSKWAKENNRKFYHFTSGSVGTYKNPFCKHPASYDPLSTGNSTSKADMMLNLRKWDGSSDVYKGRTQSILQSIFYLLENSDRTKLPKIPWNEGGIAQFVAALQAPNLFDMISLMKTELSTREPTLGERRRLQELISFYNELAQGNKSVLREQIEGLAIICRTLIMSSYSDWLAKGETPNHINLFEIATSEKAPIVLFQFNPNEEPEFAKHLGNIILSDLARASAYKNAKGNKTPFGLYIDEAQSTDPTIIAGLAEKVRSANFFLTLSYQSLEQISKSADKNGEEILNALLDTVNCFLIHNGSSYDTAEKFSKIIGKTNKTIYKSSGSRRSFLFSVNTKNSRINQVVTSTEQDYKVLPSKFQELSSPVEANGYKATAYYITKECSDDRLSNLSQVIARKIQVVVNDDVLEKVPDDFSRNLLMTSKRASISRRKPESKPTNDFPDLLPFDGKKENKKTIVNNKVKPTISNENNVKKEKMTPIKEEKKKVTTSFDKMMK